MKTVKKSKLNRTSLKWLERFNNSTLSQKVVPVIFYYLLHSTNDGVQLATKAYLERWTEEIKNEKAAEYCTEAASAEQVHLLLDLIKSPRQTPSILTVFETKEQNQGGAA